MRFKPIEAELIKLGANTVLAGRVAMVNQIAGVVGCYPEADMDRVRRGISTDPRIGYQFFFPSPGYGGSCFPKDVRGLVAQARADGYNPLLLGRIDESNEEHKKAMAEKVARAIQGISCPIVGVWGVTFKPETDDIRNSASLPVIEKILGMGARVNVYDPQPLRARQFFGERITFA